MTPMLIDAFQAAFLLLVRRAATDPDYARLRRRRGSIRRRTASLSGRAITPTSASACRDCCGVECLGADDSDAGLWHDVRPILDDELNRLPEKYRIPFVRCYLEGCTNEEAAIEMGQSGGHHSVPSTGVGAAVLQSQADAPRRDTLAGAGLTALLAHKEQRQRACPAWRWRKRLFRPRSPTRLYSATAGISAARSLSTKGVLRTMFIAKLKIGAASSCWRSRLGGGAGGGDLLSHDGSDGLPAARRSVLSLVCLEHPRQLQNPAQAAAGAADHPGSQRGGWHARGSSPRK